MACSTRPRPSASSCAAGTATSRPDHACCRTTRSATAGPRRPPYVAPRPADPLCIVYTSGTTGPAKGAVLPQGFPIEQAKIKMEAWSLGPDDVLFSTLPLYHVNARFSTLATALVSGSRAAIQPGFSAGSFWDAVRRSGATEIGTVGAISSILLLQPESPRDRDHQVRMMHGAAGIPVSRRQEFEDRFGLRLVTGFAMTETGHFSTTTPDDPRRYMASGRPVPQFEVAIVDDDDQPVEPGGVGELVVRPRRPNAMMSGYHNDPAATLAAFRNLWFHTGDLARFDEQGYLHWMDRRKDAIRRRGEMISSTEVEAVVLEHPAVAECAAIGVPSELGEEDVKVVVAARPGHTIDPHELAGYCAGRLPDFAAPRYVQVVAELPKGATHKVDKVQAPRSRCRGRHGRCDGWTSPDDGHDCAAHARPASSSAGRSRPWSRRSLRSPPRRCRRSSSERSASRSPTTWSSARRNSGSPSPRSIWCRPSGHCTPARCRTGSGRAARCSSRTR